MKQSVFVLLLISGLCTLCSCLSRQYHFVNIEKSWTEAQSYCRENYADLATIDNQEEMEALMGVVNSSYNEDAWIGLYDDRDGWQWSLADRDFYSEGETEFRNWARGAAQRYILIKEKKTWREAQSYCREHHTDLASVRNQTENQEIQQTRINAKQTGESWKWSDQSSSSYHNWRSGEPNNFRRNEGCAEVRFGHSGKWNDRRCDEKQNFICYGDNLVLVREKKSWDEALSYCRQHYGDLVSVSTEQLQHWVKRRAQNASTAHVWLGLRYSCALHFWFWVSGEGVCYQNWASGNGTMECRHTGAVESGVGQQWDSNPSKSAASLLDPLDLWAQNQICHLYRSPHSVTPCCPFTLSAPFCHTPLPFHTLSPILSHPAALSHSQPHSVTPRCPFTLSAPFCHTLLPFHTLSPILSHPAALSHSQPHSVTPCCPFTLSAPFCHTLLPFHTLSLILSHPAALSHSQPHSVTPCCPFTLSAPFCHTLLPFHTHSRHTLLPFHTLSPILSHPAALSHSQPHSVTPCCPFTLSAPFCHFGFNVKSSLIIYVL
ncbi:hypothetical protein JZ751_018400 [Albula glossodonta]|uniref:C-type lectin domain-containing protein n=1 Tax=Albula glossodonta TaxID=121402 RepID=A0A8T2MVT1_9TELE|nr:hypothetical protein JZ751_018400 [Albula glossodonta]